MSCNIKNPKLTAKNPHFGNRYAPLDEVLRVVFERLDESGADIQQTVTPEGFFVSRLFDRDGKVLREASFPFPVFTKAQELGSALTYCRRYGLTLLFNLVGEEDDDGNAASARPSKAKAKKAPADKKEW